MSATKCLPPLSIRYRRRRDLPLPRMGSHMRIVGKTGLLILQVLPIREGCSLPFDVVFPHSLLS